jgi:hypothetical protein
LKTIFPGDGSVTAAVIPLKFMQISILTLMLSILVAALACGQFVATGEYAPLFFRGSITLIISGTLAIPLVCSKKLRPFWGAYATTAGYALIVERRENDPFLFFVWAPIYYLFPDDSLHRIIAEVLQTWSPVLLGLLAGAIFAMIFRILDRDQQQIPE